MAETLSSIVRLRLGKVVFKHKPAGRDLEFYTISGVDRYGSLTALLATYSDGGTALLSSQKINDSPASRSESKAYRESLRIAQAIPPK